MAAASSLSLASCTPSLVALRLLLQHTDVCESVLTCPVEVRSLVERRAAACAAASGDEVRRVQSLFGGLRRTYAAVLQQHPSLALDLRMLVQGVNAADRSTLDVVLTRCREPLAPVLRVLPAVLSTVAGQSRAQVTVYERCTPGEHLSELPSLDVRDHAPRVRRLVARAGHGRSAMADDAAGLGTHAVSGAGGASDRTLFLLAAGTAALSSAPPTLPQPPIAPSAAEARVSRRARTDALFNQREFVRGLRAQWGVLSPQLEEWTRADGRAAAAAKCLGEALGSLAPAATRPILILAPAANASAGGAAGGAAGGEAAAAVGLVATRAAVDAARGEARRRGSGGDGQEARVWHALIRAATRLPCTDLDASLPAAPPPPTEHSIWTVLRAPRRRRGRMCREWRSSPRSPPAAAMSGGGGGGVGGGATGGVTMGGVTTGGVMTWPLNASRVGFCGVTNEGVEGDCARGDSGSWNTRVHRIHSFAACVGRCVMCARCAYVTYSPDNDDCSWYSERACRLDRLGRDEAFRSLRVFQSSRRPPTARVADVSGGGAGLLGGVADGAEPRIRAAFLDYLCAARHDRRYARVLVLGALQTLLSAALGGSATPRLRNQPEAADAASAAAGERARAMAGRVLRLHPACVESDFMLHNRQLLPLPPERGSPHPCLLTDPLGAAEGEARTPTADHASAPESTSAQAQHVVGLAAAQRGAALSHAEAPEALGGLLRRLNGAAAEVGCSAERITRFELHLSGFFSMVASVLKPWTASIRLGRSLLTPSANGLFAPSTCGAHTNLGCHFERIGPPACEPALAKAPTAARVLFNLPELTLESMTDAHAIPAAFRHLGSFWWVSQLTRRLLRPRRTLRAMVRAAAHESGLSAALAARRPVIGMHVRHGDSCMTDEQTRTARSCDPLSRYMGAIDGYARSVGATTVFLATDSEAVLADARRLFPAYTFLHVPNVSRTGVTKPSPTEIVDVVLKRRAQTGVGLEATQHDALLAAVDALLLARTDVLVGKFSSGLFRAAYAIAAARLRGALPPFISLDAPWCSDHGVGAGHNDDFPQRRGGGEIGRNEREQIDPDGRGGDNLRHSRRNTFLC